MSAEVQIPQTGAPPEALPGQVATGQLLADIVVAPCANASLSICELSTRAGSLDLTQVRQALGTEMLKVLDDGNLRRQEGTLVAQSHTLDALFAHLLHLSVNSKTLGHMETYMRLALKAQSQCRTTIETLNLMKNPPEAMFVKQQNNTNGPQQINNGVRAGVREIENQPIELLALEQRDDARVDFGTTATPIGAHSNVAPLGAVKRTANDGRKGPCEP
jgi:hypothetical protein